METQIAKDREFKAILQAHTALMIALIKTHPARDQLLTIFGRLVSLAIEAEPDPKVSGILQTLEEQYRKMVRDA